MGERLAERVEVEVPVGTGSLFDREARTDSNLGRNFIRN